MSILLIVTLALLIATAADTRLSQASDPARRRRSTPPRTTPRRRTGSNRGTRQRDAVRTQASRTETSLAKWWWE